MLVHDIPFTSLVLAVSIVCYFLKALRDRLDMKSATAGGKEAAAERGAPPQHTDADSTGRVYCDCGCVPNNVMSLHQMAALREQRKRERETKEALADNSTERDSK